ncbi:hypothetical protein H5410_050676 [Solanum commersonii]|uniref:Uncharacterized protein n=1 Tax=Solanum commersonii TaxID=4109 RepID=A0A9J5WW45_SOLCO|nr:hypothetical protein H5410_050676 [Solanum commersonii]
MRILGQGGSGLRIRQDAGSEFEMVWECEEKRCRCPVRKCERLDIVGYEVKVFQLLQYFVVIVLSMDVDPTFRIN